MLVCSLFETLIFSVVFEVILVRAIEHEDCATSWREISFCTPAPRGSAAVIECPCASYAVETEGKAYFVSAQNVTGLNCSSIGKELCNTPTANIATVCQNQGQRCDITRHLIPNRCFDSQSRDYVWWNFMRVMYRCVFVTPTTGTTTHSTVLTSTVLPASQTTGNSGILPAWTTVSFCIPDPDNSTAVIECPSQNYIVHTTQEAYFGFAANVTGSDCSIRSEQLCFTPTKNIANRCRNQRHICDITTLVKSINRCYAEKLKSWPYWNFVRVTYMCVFDNSTTEASTTTAVMTTTTRTTTLSTTQTTAETPLSTSKATQVKSSPSTLTTVPISTETLKTSNRIYMPTEVQTNRSSYLSPVTRPSNIHITTTEKPTTTSNISTAERLITRHNGTKTTKAVSRAPATVTERRSSAVASMSSDSVVLPPTFASLLLKDQGTWAQQNANWFAPVVVILIFVTVVAVLVALFLKRKQRRYNVAKRKKNAWRRLSFEDSAM